MLRKKKTQQQSKITKYPIGTFIRTESGVFFVLSETKRARFTTDRALASWSPITIADAKESDIAVKRLRVSLGSMKFRNGSLLFSQATGRMYLVSEGKLRHITNPDVLAALGFTRSDAVWVSKSEINLHEMGEELSG